MTTTIEITKAAIKDPRTRMDLVKTALRAELESRGIKVGQHIGQLDGVSTGFRISVMEAYFGSVNKDRLTVSMGDWGAKKSYSEPIKAGYDIPKLADRLLVVLKEMKADRERKDGIRNKEEASCRLANVVREEFPDIAYQFNGCGTEDNVKLSAQYLTLDQAREVATREVATLLMKFKTDA
jgi:hypothetical protein